MNNSTDLIQKFIKESMSRGDQFIPSAVAKLDNMFCGCGFPEQAYKWVLAYLLSLANGSWDDEQAGGDTWIAVYLMDHLRLTEHGSSLSCPWLTDDGMVVIGFLCCWGIDWQDKARFISSEGIIYGTF